MYKILYMCVLILLTLLGYCIGQNRRWGDKYEKRNRAEDARDLYFIDGLAQRVRATPQNSRNIILEELCQITASATGTPEIISNIAETSPVGETVHLQHKIVGLCTPHWLHPRSKKFLRLLCLRNSLKLYTSGPVQLATDGSVDLTTVDPWVQPQIIGFNLKPMSINILVHHYGNVATTGGQLINYGQLVHVDSFSLSLIAVVPAPQGNNFNSYLQTTELTGISGGIGTKITVRYGLQCNNNLPGENCDLLCSTSSTSFSKIVCNSTITGKTYSCNATNNTYGMGSTSDRQVSNCTYCPYGAYMGYCSPAPGVGRSTSGTGVAYGYYVATIVLAVIVGILLIILLAAILLWCWGSREEEDDRRRTEWSFRNRNRPDVVKSSPPVGGAYTPVSTQPDSEWQPTRTTAAMQRTSVTDSHSGSNRPTQPYYDHPTDKHTPPIATAESTGSRGSHASSTGGNYQNGPRREAAV